MRSSCSGFTLDTWMGKSTGTMFGVRSEADAELTKKTPAHAAELYCWSVRYR